MSHLIEALVGWLIIMGMVFGGAGALLLVMSAVRALVLLARRVRIAPPEPREAPSIWPREAASR